MLPPLPLRPPVLSRLKPAPPAAMPPVPVKTILPVFAALELAPAAFALRMPAAGSDSRPEAVRFICPPLPLVTETSGKLADCKVRFLALTSIVPPSPLVAPPRALREVTVLIPRTPAPTVMSAGVVSVTVPPLPRAAPFADTLFRVMPALARISTVPPVPAPAPVPFAETAPLIAIEDELAKTLPPVAPDVSIVIAPERKEPIAPVGVATVPRLTLPPVPVFEVAFRFTWPAPEMINELPVVFRSIVPPFPAPGAFAFMFTVPLVMFANTLALAPAVGLKEIVPPAPSLMPLALKVTVPAGSLVLISPLALSMLIEPPAKSPAPPAFALMSERFIAPLTLVKLTVPALPFEELRSIAPRV